MKTTLEIVLDEINMVMESDYTMENKDTPLNQLNIDSLYAVEIELALEERFGLDLPDEGLSNRTPQQIADIINVAKKKGAQ